MKSNYLSESMTDRGELLLQCAKKKKKKEKERIDAARTDVDSGWSGVEEAEGEACCCAAQRH